MQRDLAFKGWQTATYLIWSKKTVWYWEWLFQMSLFNLKKTFKIVLVFLLSIFEKVVSAPFNGNTDGEVDASCLSHQTNLQKNLHHPISSTSLYYHRKIQTSDQPSLVYFKSICNHCRQHHPVLSILWRRKASCLSQQTNLHSYLSRAFCSKYENFAFIVVNIIVFIIFLVQWKQLFLFEPSDQASLKGQENWAQNKRILTSSYQLELIHVERIMP